MGIEKPVSYPFPVQLRGNNDANFQVPPCRDRRASRRSPSFYLRSRCSPTAAQAGTKSIDLDSLPQETHEAILEFQQIYSLEAGQVLKRVSPPYPPGRVEVYRRKMERQAKILPEGPDYFIFRLSGDGKVTLPLHERLRYSQLGWVGDEGKPVGSLIESFTDISPRNMIGDAELIGTKVAGDWIVRSGATDESHSPNSPKSYATNADCPFGLSKPR